MKAITLHQPYASLIALSAKTIETRSWKPPAALIGQRLLIHAGARKPHKGQTGDWYTIEGSSLYRMGTTMGAPVHSLPLGAIVASCVLTDAVPMVDAADAAFGQGRAACDRCVVVGDDFLDLCTMFDEEQPTGDSEGDGFVSVRMDPPNIDADAYLIQDISDQRPYGDFAPGRWAWLLEDVKPTTERCPACWGSGSSDDLSQAFYVGSAIEPASIPPCGYCNGTAVCDPIPAKGKQGLWNWDPAVG